MGQFPENCTKQILDASAEIFCAMRFEKVTVTDISNKSGVPEDLIVALFSDTKTIANQILDIERNSMRQAITVASKELSNPVESLKSAFSTVAWNIVHSVKIRAGIRLAAESSEYFPDRKLDPFGTWQLFVHSKVKEAQSLGLMRTDMSPDDITWVIVSAGIGTKELLRMQNQMILMPEKFDMAISLLLDCLSPRVTD